MMTSAARLLPLALLWAGAARAQTSTVAHEPSFSVERLVPATGPGAFLQVEDAQILGDRGLALSLVSSLAGRPLVIRRVGKGTVMTEPVALRLGVDLGVAYGIRDRLQLFAALPLVAFQDGDRLRGLDLGESGSERSLAPFAAGDARLGAKLALLAPERGYGPGLALAGLLTLPTGDETQFAGEAGVVVEGRAIASLRGARWAVAGNLGPRLRTRSVVFFNPNLVMGHELAWGVAGSLQLPLPRAWRQREPTALVEIAGAWGGSDGPSPAEARAGLRVRIASSLVAGVSGGAGIGDARAIGAPEWRAVLELRWERAPAADLDRDGIPDAVDQCPDEPEDIDGFQDEDGCPDPDNDGDGIPDAADQCPNQPEDRDHFQDQDGCPDPDNDGDGIPDVVDKCPNEPEDKDGFLDDDGCPDKDNDVDGIPDELDKCPNEPEDKDGFQDEDGCPDPDNDGDGIPDVVDKCPDQPEDKDGWRDDDGCPDLDDDRDGVPDEVDRCPDAPETITSPRDREQDGCPDGPPMAQAKEDGSIWLSPAARAALLGGRRDDAEWTAVAIARAAHHAGWDDAPPPADVLVVTVPGDGPVWSPLAERRSDLVVRTLEREGVRARVEAVARPKGVTIRATPEALEAGRHVVRRGG